MFVTVKDLCKTYHAQSVDTQVLRGVSLEMEKGQVGVILGPSGSGKTTLLNIIGGIDQGDGGSVEVNGTQLASLTDAQLTRYRRQDVGYVFQFYHLVPDLTVAENIEVIAAISQNPLPTSQVLDAVGMADKARRFPRELSGGEQQRVAIARAVVKNPALLLCDEPTGALDFETAKGVLGLLQSVNQTYGTTLLMITHNNAIGAMAHRVFRLRGGEVVDTQYNTALLPAERMEW